MGRGEPDQLTGLQLGALLALLMGAPSLVTFVLGALGPSIVAELELSRTQFGLVSTFVSITAIIASVTLGTLVDRFGPRPAGTTMLAGSATSILLLSTAPSYSVLLGLAVVAGLAQAIANPLTNSLIARLPPERPRGLVMGVKQSGVQMAQFTVGATLPWLAVHIGWRLSSIAAMLPVLVAAVLFWWSLPGPDRSTPRQRASGDAAVPTANTRSKGLVALCAYTFLLALSIQPVNLYLPLYAVETDLLSPAVAGSTVGLVGALGIVSRISMGQLASALVAPDRLLSPLALGAALSILVISLAQGRSASLLWIGAALFATSALAGNVVVMLTVLDLAHGGRTGHASGLVSAAMFMGFATGPAAFGVLVDTTGSYPLAWRLIGGCCVLAALMGGRVRRSTSARQPPVPPAATCEDRVQPPPPSEPKGETT